MLADQLSAEAFCSGFRQLLEKLSAIEHVESLLRLNKENISRMCSEVPDFTTAKGVHYADVLDQLAHRRIDELRAAASQTPPASSSGVQEVTPQPDLSASPTPLASEAISPPLLRPSKIAPGPRIDKSELVIATERRYCDKAHLKFVASQPCLVCGRQPSHAHPPHLRADTRPGTQSQ